MSLHKDNKVVLYADFHIVDCNYMIMERQTDRNRQRDGQPDRQRQRGDRDSRPNLFLVCCESDDKAAY